MRFSKATLILLLLSACKVPIVAELEATGETFIGEASPYEGKLYGKIIPTGVTCSSNYEPPIVWDEKSAYTLEGTISCADGRTGWWVITGSNIMAKGAGVLDGKKFKISVGTDLRN